MRRNRTYNKAAYHQDTAYEQKRKNRVEEGKNNAKRKRQPAMTAENQQRKRMDQPRYGAENTMCKKERNKDIELGEFLVVPYQSNDTIKTSVIAIPKGRATEQPN